MKDFNAESVAQDTHTAVHLLQAQPAERLYPAYIGLDVHKETIAWAIAREGRSEPEYRGEIANRPKAVEKLVARLNKEFDGEVLLWCYEAGPCGYVPHRPETCLWVTRQFPTLPVSTPGGGTPG